MKDRQIVGVAGFLRVLLLGLALLLTSSFAVNTVHAGDQSGAMTEVVSSSVSAFSATAAHPDAAACYEDVEGDADCDCRVTTGDIFALAGSWQQNIAEVAPNGVNVSHIVKAASQLGERCLPTGVVTLNTSNTNLASARAMGANYARVIVEWSKVEPNQGDRKWQESGYDAKISRVTSAGLHPLVEVRNVPSWARKDEAPWKDVQCGLMKDTHYQTGPSSGFWLFIRDLVERYDGDGVSDASGLARPVRLYENGNEPESSNTSGEHYGYCYGPIPDPNAPNDLDEADYGPAHKYAELMRVFTDAVHMADPYSLSVFGGMMYQKITVWTPPLDSNRWLNEVLSVSQASDFDVMNIHSYIAINCGKTMQERAGEVRQQMANFGIDKPVMVTEAGMASWWKQDGSEVKICDDWASEERQANYVPQLYNESVDADLFANFWFTEKDFFAPEDDWGAGYGLIRGDGTYKPGYAAYQNWVNQVQNTTFVRSLTEDDLGSADVTGYEFRTDDGHLKWVVWSSIQASDATRRITLPWDHVRVTGNLGTGLLDIDFQKAGVREIVDASSDDLGPVGDGAVTLKVGSSPIYVEQW